MEQIRMEEDNIERQQDQQQRRARGPQNERPPPPAQRCPRCNSSETRFGYYNNYNINQPRYFCKSCKRHWTHGGVLKKVPNGSSCRKNKRPGIASSSSGGDVAIANHSFPTVLSPPLNAGVTSIPSSGILAPIIMPTGSSFYSGGTFSSQLTMQTLPDRINQSAVIGDGGGEFGANVAHFQEISLPPLPPQMPHQFQPPINYFSTHDSMTLPRPVASWSQSFINNTVSNSTSTTNLLSNDDGSSVVDGGDHAGFSFNPIHQWSMWSDDNPGFGPPQL